MDSYAKSHYSVIPKNVQCQHSSYYYANHVKNVGSILCMDTHRIGLSSERWPSDIKKSKKDRYAVKEKSKSKPLAYTVPGRYILSQLVLLNRMPLLKPKYVVIKGVTWQSGFRESQTGWAIFPETFQGIVPVEIATNELLCHYGAFIADHNEKEVTLTHNHTIRDFTYGDHYLEEHVLHKKGLNGSGMEKHTFQHMACPLREDSGAYLLARWAENDEMHMTFFRVPLHHSLFLPAGIMHSNDYLKGVWRTMLDETAFNDMVQFVRISGNGKHMHKFQLKFGWCKT